MNDNPFQPANRISLAGFAATTTAAMLSKPGTYGRGRFVVRASEEKTSKQGPYLSLKLADQSGEAGATCWKGAPLLAQLPVGTVVELQRLVVDDWGAKFEVGDLRVLKAGDFRPDEFVPSLPKETILANWEEFHGFLDSIRNPHLQALRKKIWGDPGIGTKYKLHPSGVYHHHAYIGGNVQHVLGIMRIVEGVCTGYPALDRDLCLFGAAIHDLGKLKEYEVDTTIRVTDDGRLRGHLVIGAEWIGQLCAALRAEGHAFPPALEADLVHMILSHHGKGEWGSPKPPATPEAMLLHLADYTDSQTKKFLQDVEANAANPDGWAKTFDRDTGENRWFRTRRED
jgi:3'-5' exoribonuclease